MQPFTGEPMEPEIRMIYQGVEMLEAGVDYAVTYSNNIEKGTVMSTALS